MLMIRLVFQSSECVGFGSTLIGMSNILVHPEASVAKIRLKEMLEAANVNLVFDDLLLSWQIIMSFE